MSASLTLAASNITEQVFLIPADGDIAADAKIDLTESFWGCVATLGLEYVDRKVRTGDGRMFRVIVEEIQACRVCGCTDDDCHQCIMRTGEPCSWVEPDLCSACVSPPQE